MSITTVPCNLVELQKAIDAATPGDVIRVSPGSTNATTPITVSKAIEIRLDPASIIIDDFTAGDLFTLIEPLAGELRISGGDFRTGLGPTPGIPHHFAKWIRADHGKPMVWTDSKFDLGYGSNAFGLATNRGLIARNTFKASVGGNICANNAAALRLKPRDLGDVWMRPHKWGVLDVNQDQAVFFEDNTLFDVFEGVDVDDNGICVLRHNRMSNSGFLHHGVDTGWDGARASEVYDNDFIWDASVKCGVDQPAGTNSMIYVRGGTIKLFRNRIDNITSQWWGDKSEVTFTTEELRRNAGRFPCTKAYPAFHQSGWGYTIGAIAVGGQRQDLEPSYIWDNVGGGNYANPAIHDFHPNQCAPDAPSAVEFIKIGREVILGPAPNYTPASYPHPRANSAPIPPIDPPIEPPIEPPVEPPVEPPANKPPTVTIMAPMNSQVIKWNKDFTISVVATDDVGVAWLEIYIDNYKVKDGTGPAMTYKWSPRPYRGKSVIISAAARDAGGLVTTTQVTVQVR